MLRTSFPSCIPVEKPQFTREADNLHPQWLAGFTSGEGYFGVKFLKSSTIKTGVQVKLIFQITQHIRDEMLMKSLENYFGCGKFSISTRGGYGDFQVGKFSDITGIIIPFFQNNKIEGVKSEDFKDWCKIVMIMKDKHHLTLKGLEQIKTLRSSMNKGRY